MTNGETEAAVLSARVYDQLANCAALVKTLAMIRRSKAEIQAGRVNLFRAAIEEIARQHGMTLGL